MRIAVIGGTGVAGRHTIEAVRRAGHDAVIVARSRGIDVSTGEGLDDALDGVDAVIDVSNLQAPDAEASRRALRDGHPEHPGRRAASERQTSRTAFHRRRGSH